VVVFLVSGLWHGANWTFVIWGGLNGAYQVLSLAFQRARGARGGDQVRRPALATVILGRVVTFHLVLVTWVFFRASSLADATGVLTRVASSAPRLPALLRTRLASDEVLVSIGLIALLLVVEVLDERAPVWDRLRIRPVYVRWAVYYGLLIALAVLGRWNLQQFVYMQF
jgi:D-alanyl-lipoteichoic acid acyltransferase DltB (MBOAT superfamily)